MYSVVTIDGPSGSGKGTICRLVAEATGFALLDSGALYRLTALASLNANIDLDSEAAVAALAEQLDIGFVAQDNYTQVILAGDDVTKTIREERVGMTASKVAAYPDVRAALLNRQRAFLTAPGLVADGRDMGTVVFPDAPLKVFLTASAEERARRRVQQLKDAGETDIDYAKILADIEQRDYQDRNRAVAPLVPAADAIELDSTSLSIDAVFQIIMRNLSELGIKPS
ncbi:(d)CMP kinase [Teredinibacter waterburyi]|jgi:cytidylate kinase (EC 2.7.4.14)|uniref:(d)CMP kinase n=1 Tax=Teredinibacter waterburyi TaxID=1500538 RepID=UPI00165EFB63|nr:(d)CMP kinase [Teredinibacter waterburyi]